MANSTPDGAQEPLSDRDDAISRQLVDARLSARPLPDFPDRLPETLEQAYAIQTASIARWPDEVAGWKVARLSPTDRERLSAERLVGPVFRSSICRVAPESCEVMPVFEGGFAAVEAEFVLELGATVQPSDRNYTDDELIDLVSAAYCGAEIASSPMALVNDLGPTSIISDFGCNAGVVVGPQIPDWHTLPKGSLSASVTVDDNVVGQADLDALTGSPLQALRFLIAVCGSRGIELPEGTVVSTGMLTGVHEVQVSSAVRVDFGAGRWFDLKFEPITPKQ